MSDALLAEFQDVIRKNLPAHLGDELQKLLADGVTTKQKLADTTHSLRSKNAECEELNRRVTSERKLIEREEAVKKREDEVLKREIKMELNEYKVTAAAERIADLKAVTLAVFANNQFKYERQSHSNKQVPAPSGSCTQYINENSTDQIKTEG